jgi:hypothetical protein
MRLLQYQASVRNTIYQDGNVNEEEEPEEEEFRETEENSVNDLEVIEASLNAAAYSELDGADAELDQPYVIPRGAQFEEHDWTGL